MGLVEVRQKAGIYFEELLEWIDGQRWKDKWFFCSPFVVFFDVILVWHLKEKHGDCLFFRWFRPEVGIWNILFTMFWPNRKNLFRIYGFIEILQLCAWVAVMILSLANIYLFWNVPPNVAGSGSGQENGCFSITEQLCAVSTNTIFHLTVISSQFWLRFAIPLLILTLISLFPLVSIWSNPATFFTHWPH